MQTPTRLEDDRTEMSRGAAQVPPPVEPKQPSALAHKPGAKLEAFDRGRWVPCIIMSIADYVGRSGPGYYAAYDPPNSNCTSFWCNDNSLRLRAKAQP